MARFNLLRPKPRIVTLRMMRARAALLQAELYVKNLPMNVAEAWDEEFRWFMRAADLRDEAHGYDPKHIAPEWRKIPNEWARGWSVDFA